MTDIEKAHEEGRYFYCPNCGGETDKVTGLCFRCKDIEDAQHDALHACPDCGYTDCQCTCCPTCGSVMDGSVCEHCREWDKNWESTVENVILNSFEQWGE